MAITIDQFLRDLTERELLSPEEAQTVRGQLSANVPESAALRAGSDQADAVTVMTPASLVLCDCLVRDKLRDDGHQLIFNAQSLSDDSAVTIHLLIPENGAEKSRLNGAPANAGETSRPRAVTGVARHGEMVFICCKSLEAETLEQLVLQNGALPLELATETLLQTARTLNRLQEQGLFLQEVSPELLLLDEDGHVHLTGGSPHPFLKSDTRRSRAESPYRLHESLGQLYLFLLSGRAATKSASPDLAWFLHSAGDEEAADGHRSQSAQRVYARLMDRDAGFGYNNFGELIQDLASLQAGQESPAAASSAEAVPASKPASSAESSRPTARWVVAALVLVGAIVVMALFNALK
jgi:hypothetical protein